MQHEAEIAALMETAVRERRAVLAAPTLKDANRWRSALYRFREKLLNHPEGNPRLALLAPLITFAIHTNAAGTHLTLTYRPNHS